MITPKRIAVLAMLLSVVHQGTSATSYVDVNGSNPIPPYTNWSSAAVTIQDAIDAAVDGDLVLVTNGVYNTGGRTVYGTLTNRIVVDKAITVQSVNGPLVTFIEGNTPLGDTAVRCAYLTNGATLCGFTLTNGATLTSFAGQSVGDRALYASGAGAWCESTSATLTNCVLIGNEAEYGYGGMGGGAYSGTLQGCVLTGNKAVKGGGAFGSVLNNCIVSNNLALATVALNAGTAVSTYGGGVQNCQLTNCSVLRNRSDTYGGGAASSTLVDCAVEENSAYTQGGGVYLGTFIRCRLARNAARDQGGGVYSGTVSHCVIIDNYAANGGGASLGLVTHSEFSGNSALVNGGGTYQANVTASAFVNNSAATNGGGAFGGTLNNCTVAGNSAREGGGVYQATVANSIVYFNQAPSASNYSGGTLMYCCTTPAPPSGSGNITNDPVLADGYHLSASSPCAGAGGAAPSVADDIDGDAWSNPPSIGCDEYQAASASGPMTISVRRDYLNARPGAPIQLAARLEGHAASSSWDFGDGTTLTNQPYVSHRWTLPGVYAAKFLAANGTNPEGVTNSFEVQVVAEPTLYVAQQNLSPQPPFLSWATAATNIQDAVDLAFAGGSTVLVSDGLYRTGGRANAGVLTNRVCLSRPVTVQSVSGPTVTIIEGRRLGAVPYGSDVVRFPGYSNGDDAARCVYACEGASLIGFTLTNGATRAGTSHASQVEFSGGGVFCESTNVVISDCVIVSNSCNWFGGGAYFGTLNQCQVNSNLNLNGSLGGGGGVAFSVVLNSTVAGNSGGGGGALSSTLSNCLVAANSGYGSWKCQLYGCVVSGSTGGGLRDGSANDCIISGNNAGINLSGGGANSTTLSNCVLYSNRARDGGGAYNCAMDYCSVSNNYATNSGGGVYWSVGTPSLPPAGNNNILVGNGTGGNGGGLYLGARNLAVTNWIFTGNSAAGNGGGIYAASSTWTLQGFTFTSNSAALAGGGFYAAAGSWTLQNSPFTGNNAGTDGGGIAVAVGATVSCYGSTLRSNTTTRYGGAGYNGTYLNCLITGNSAYDSGGGVYATSALLTSTNSLVSGNLALTNGGGVFGGTWSGCKFVGNTGRANGGGANNASLARSIVTDNNAKLGGGVYNTPLSQCLLTRNTADTGGGVYSGLNQAVNHSTIVGNFATNAGGGVYAAGPSPGILSSILYFNSAPTSSNYSGGTRTFCCLLPASTGTGNITNDPALIDWAGGNFRLQTNSPCINAGSGTPGGTIDLDGRPRVVGGVIDKGAYEFQGAGLGEFIYWLQQYGLPTDGSADYADADSDQMNNWQEWIAGTSPTNSQSVLKLVSLTPSPSGATLSWQSVAGRNYWVERVSDPVTPSGFSLIQSNIPGLVGSTTFMDAAATNSVEYFYRVGVK